MKSLKQSLMVLFCMLLMVVSIESYAVTLAELFENDKVRIKVWIEPEKNIVARQQVNLQIEVATDKWFSSGTKIGYFEVKDAIVLQREKFAVNSIREEGEKTWTIQQWTLVIYPQRDGVFEVPAIPLQLSIAGDGAESVVVHRRQVFGASHQRSTSRGDRGLRQGSGRHDTLPDSG